MDKLIRGIRYLFFITAILVVLFILVGHSNAQLYFPFTSGLSDFYNFGTTRYGTLFGLSPVSPFGTGVGYYGLIDPIWWGIGLYPWLYY